MPKERVVGVDLARGIALLGMIAVHVFPIFRDDGDPSTATVVAAGRSAATFVLVAGVGLAFLSGGRMAVRGRERTAVAAGLAIRAALIGTLGLGLGLLARSHGVIGILSFYGLLFMVAIPLLWLSPRALVGVAVAAIILGPVFIVATADAGLPYLNFEGEPTPAMLARDLWGSLILLMVTGGYPIVVYLAYLCAGLAIGRLDLTSRRIAWWLLGAGAALALVARVVSEILLYSLGGLASLISAAGPTQPRPGKRCCGIRWSFPRGGT